MEKLIRTYLIKDYLKEKDISKTHFCKLCGISPTTLDKILNNNYYFRYPAIFKIAKVMEIRMDEIFY